DVFQYLRGDALARLVLELGDQPLGAPADGAGQMQIGRRRAAAWQNERFQRRKLSIEPVDLAFEPGHLRVGHREPRAARSFALARRAQVGTDVEQIILDAPQRRIERGVFDGMQPGDAERGIDLVEGAVGGNAQVVFPAPLAGAERRGAVIPGAGVDLVEDDHRSLWVHSGSLGLTWAHFDITQTVNMMMMRAMNCSRTRNRISF